MVGAGGEGEGLRGGGGEDLTGMGAGDAVDDPEGRYASKLPFAWLTCVLQVAPAGRREQRSKAGIGRVQRWQWQLLR